MVGEKVLEVRKIKIRVSGKVMIFGDFYNYGVIFMRYSKIGGMRWNI